MSQNDPVSIEPMGNPECPWMHADPPSHADNGHVCGPWCENVRGQWMAAQPVAYFFSNHPDVDV